MKHLFRELAPISPAAWQEIETEAQRTLKTTLAARRIVDFVGPLGWQESAVSTGRTEMIAMPGGTGSGAPSGVEARLRRVQPMVDFRVPFEVQRSELDAVERGAKDLDLGSVGAAARAIALAEDRAIFHGCPAAAILGICEGVSGAALTLTDDYAAYPVAVAEALRKLRHAGVDGPFAIALSERCYTGLTETAKSGYPVIDHVRRLVDGPIVWAPALDGAVVLSMRGDDFELIVGQDFSIGYLEHDAVKVRLYIEESFTFRLLSPQAAIPLAYKKTGRKPAT